MIALMLKKLIAPLTLALFLGGCVVHSHGRRARRHDPACPPGHAWDNGRCHPRGKAKGHKKKDKDVVIIRDHRR
jgi:hypothetical protein